MELVKLTGTPKQVGWAEEIRKANIAHLQDRLRDFELRAARGDDFPEIRAALQKAIEGLMAQPTEARWWIEHRRIAWVIEQKIIKSAAGSHNQKRKEEEENKWHCIILSRRAR